jgi:hypothetical protein
MSADKLREEVASLVGDCEDTDCNVCLARAVAILAAIRREVEKVPIVERVGNIHGTTPDERINRADVLRVLGKGE